MIKLYSKINCGLGPCASGQCFRICLHVGMQFLSIACAIYLSHFEEKVSFQVKITLNTGG